MRILAVLTAVAILGCTDDLASVSETKSAIVIDNRLTANRLTANRLTANRLTANRLTANRLTANRIELNVIDAEGLLETADGRELLSFIISCAINEDQTLVATFEGNTYEFFGELGLANRWLDRPLDRKGKGWVSACLFARVNANNVAIPVSLRGSHRKLTVTPEEASNWSLQEGAFYGNYFTPVTEPIDWTACRGSDQAAGEFGGLVERDCAEPDPANPGRTICGFKFAGECGKYAPKQKYACKSFSESGTFYDKCGSSAKFGGKKHHKGSYRSDDDDDSDSDSDHGDHDDDSDSDSDHHGGWNDRHTNRQVITTYVIP